MYSCVYIECFSRPPSYRCKKPSLESGNTNNDVCIFIIVIRTYINKQREAFLPFLIFFCKNIFNTQKHGVNMNMLSTEVALRKLRGVSFTHTEVAGIFLQSCFFESRTGGSVSLYITHGNEVLFPSYVRWCITLSVRAACIWCVTGNDSFHPPNLDTLSTVGPVFLSLVVLCKILKLKLFGMFIFLKHNLNRLTKSTGIFS